MAKKSILVVAAHPDDEVLGCGGTLAKHTANGDNVQVLFLADGESARGNLNKLGERRNSCLKSLQCVGIEKRQITFGDFPDNRMDQVSLLDIVKFIENASNDFKPDIVYTHHHGDLNIDHALTNRAVMTAFRPFPDKTTKEIFGFEVLSSTGWLNSSPGNIFCPARFVDISGFWDKKLAAVKKYDDEMRPFPHARSYRTLEALASYRGSFVGLEKAEAFTVIRQICR